MANGNHNLSWQMKFTTCHGKWNSQLVMVNGIHNLSWQMEFTTCHGKWNSQLVMANGIHNLSWYMEFTTCHGKWNSQLVMANEIHNLSWQMKFTQGFSQRPVHLSFGHTILILDPFWTPQNFKIYYRIDRNWTHSMCKSTILDTLFQNPG